MRQHIVRIQVRPSVVVVFFAWFCASVAMAPKIEVGLDQEISMPGMCRHNCNE